MGKKKRKKTQKYQPFDASRGTPVWGLDQFRADALVQLMKDLHGVQESGLEVPQCKLVQNSLEQLEIEASAIPDKSFIRRSIMDELINFRKTYIDWNDPEGKDPKVQAQRRKHLERLKKRRHSLAKVVRRNKHIISKGLDLKIVEGMYEALGELPKSLPEIFINVSKAIARFEKRLGNA